MRLASLLVAAAVIGASCGGADPAASAAPGTGGARPAFLTLPLVDVRTGERFELGGFPGKVTFVIAMAVW